MKRTKPKYQMYIAFSEITDTMLEPTNFLIALRFVSSLNDTKKAEFLFWDALTFMAFVLKDQRPDMFVYVIGPEGKDFWYRLY